MNSVVKIKDKVARPGTVDLRQDNRIGDLLDEYELAARRFRDIKKEKDALTEEIKGKLGDAKIAFVNGWILRRSSFVRKEHFVKSAVVDRLVIERQPKLAMKRIASPSDGSDDE